MLRLVQLESCGSTNDEALRLLPETTLVVTRRQTKGRGRQGRKWDDGTAAAAGTEAGAISIHDTSTNFMMSLALVPPERLEHELSWVPLAAGVACVQALEALEIGAAATRASGDLRLKWPNDLMWGDAKMGGVLCETRFKGAAIAGLVIGVGVNFGIAPEVDGVATTCFAAHAGTGRVDEPATLEAARRAFIQNWSDRMLFWIDELSAGRTSGLRKEWLRAAKLDRFNRYSAASASHWFGAAGGPAGGTAGRALDLDERGRLIVETEAGQRLVVDQAP